MPERFKRRDIQTFVADAVSEWAYAEYQADRSPEPYLSNLLPRVDGEWDLPEQIPSKYHKLIGMRAMDAEQWETALLHLERSTELYAKAGNETRISKCRKALAKQQAAIGSPE
ncbi:Phage small terminase subunit [compost metagenome]